jgi:hypothetical protein
MLNYRVIIIHMLIFKKKINKTFGGNDMKTAKKENVSRRNQSLGKWGLVCVFDSTQNSKKKGAHAVGCKN